MAAHCILNIDVWENLLQALAAGRSSIRKCRELPQMVIGMKWHVVMDETLQYSQIRHHSVSDIIRLNYVTYMYIYT